MAFSQYRFRRDTSANWVTNNPTLVAGEMGLDTTSGRFKVGNGTDAWTALDYANDSENVTFVLTEGNAFVGTDLATIEYFPYAAEITSLVLVVKTAPTGSTLVVDLNKNDVSILSTKISIDATETDSTTAATAYVLSSTSIAVGDRLSVDIDQIGATLPGVNVQLIANLVRV